MRNGLLEHHFTEEHPFQNNYMGDYSSLNGSEQQESINKYFNQKSVTMSS